MVGSTFTIPNEEAREMLSDLAIEERRTIRYVLMNEPTPDEERQDLIHEYNTLGQIFDLEQWDE